MKKIFVFLLSALVLTSACTSEFKVKSKALVLSATRFDNEVKTRAQENFVDAEQQKVYADFLKKHSRVDLSSFEMKGDSEAVGEVVVATIPRAMDAELKATSGKEWNDKVSSKVETKSYPITMKKVNDIWEIQGLPFPEKAPVEAKKPAL